MCCSVVSPEIVMHDSAYIGGRSENNIKCVVHDDLGRKNQTTRYILPRHWLYEWFSQFHRCGIYSVLSRSTSFINKMVKAVLLPALQQLRQEVRSVTKSLSLVETFTIEKFQTFHGLPLVFQNNSVFWNSRTFQGRPRIQGRRRNTEVNKWQRNPGTENDQQGPEMTSFLPT